MNNLLHFIFFLSFIAQNVHASKWESLIKDITTSVKDVINTKNDKDDIDENTKNNKKIVATHRLLIPNDSIEAKYYVTQIKNYASTEKSKKEKWNQLFLDELFQTVLKRKINLDELNRYMDQLNQNGSREGIYHYIVLSGEYQKLEDQKPLTPNSIVLIQHFLKQFLSYEINLDRDLPFYQLKSEIVDMSLTRFYRIWTKPEDLYHWYSEISRYLATRPKVSWKFKLRQSPEYKIHYEWSKSVPPELIKSELILKIHSYLNQIRLY